MIWLYAGFTSLYNLLKICSLLLKIGQFCLLVNEEAAVRRCFLKKVFVESFALFTEKYLCWSFFLIKLQACNLIKKRIQHVFSCEYCEIFKNSFLYRTSLVAASAYDNLTSNWFSKYLISCISGTS